MEDNSLNRETSEPPSSPILQSRADIRSGMDPAGPSSHAKGGNVPKNSDTLLALASFLETLSKQQQASMQANDDFLAGLLFNLISTTQRPRLSDIYIASFTPDGNVPIRDWCSMLTKQKITGI